MYTEVKELVNLVARFLFPKIPRIKVCLFAEHYANLLLVRFSDNWDIFDPVHGDKFRIFTLRNGDELDRDLQCSANMMLVRKDILMKLIPDGVSVRIGPGYVTYRVNEYAPLVSVWNGASNADDNYSPFPEFVLKWQNSNMGMFGPTNMGIGFRGGAIYGQSNVDDGNKLDVHDFVPLRLIVRPTFGYIDPNLPRSPYRKIFEYTGKEDSTMEVGQFAMTRFGSQKKRPDYELMQRIQRQVPPESIMPVGHEGFPPPPTPFADTSSPAPKQFVPFNKVNDGRMYCYSAPQQTSVGSAGDIPAAKDETSVVSFLQEMAKTGGLNDTFNGPHVIQNAYAGICHDMQELSPMKKY